MNKQNQNGSLHSVLMIVVIAVIVGALSFVVWKNFIDKDNVLNTENKEAGQQVQDAPEAKMLVGQIDSLFPAALTWNYPESWLMESQGKGPISAEETGDQTITMTSPSGNFQVAYRVIANGGLGGTCDPESAGKINYIKKETIDGFEDTLFVEYIKNIDPWEGIDGEQDPNKFTYKSAILNGRASVQQAQVGSSFCDVYSADVISLAEKYNTQLVGTEIRIKNIDSSEEQGRYTQDINDIKKYYDDAEYQQAVGILLSTRKN